ncbi:MAG: hypothetical protein GY716_21455 [bacterium]|nr:hypothetical protein [bacterium]
MKRWLIVLLALVVVGPVLARVEIIDGLRWVEPTVGDSCEKWVFSDVVLMNKDTGKQYKCDDTAEQWQEVPISFSIANKTYYCDQYATSGDGTWPDPYIGWDDAETGCVKAAQECSTPLSVHNNCQAVFPQGLYQCTASDCLGKQKGIAEAVDGMVFEGSGTGGSIIIGNYAGAADFYFVDGCGSADVVGTAIPWPDNSDPPGAVVSGGTFTDDNRAEFDVAIDTAGTPDSFKWRKRTRGTSPLGAWSASTPMTGAAQALSDGVTIDFEFDTGHAVNDLWRIEAGYCNPVGGTNDYKDVTFRNLSFVGANPSTADGGGLVTQIPTNAYGFRVFSTGQAQSWRFESSKLAMLQGGISFNGTGTASENKFIASEITKIGPYGYAVELNNEQSINHDFMSSDVEGVYGHSLQFGPEGGGDVQVFGGSWIVNDPEEPYRPKTGWCTDDVFTSCTEDNDCADEITTASGAELNNADCTDEDVPNGCCTALGEGTCDNTLIVADADSLSVGDWVFITSSATEGRMVTEKISSTEYELHWTGIGVTDEISYSDTDSIRGGATCDGNATGFIWAMSGGGPNGSAGNLTFNSSGFEPRLDSQLVWIPTNRTNIAMKVTFNDCHFVNNNTDPKEWVVIGAKQHVRFRGGVIRENGAPMYYRLTGEIEESNTASHLGWIDFEDVTVSPMFNRLDERILLDNENFGRATAEGIFGAQPTQTAEGFTRAGYSFDRSSRATPVGLTDAQDVLMILAGTNDGWPGYDSTEGDSYGLERNLKVPLHFTISEIDCHKPTGTGSDDYIFRVGSQDESETYCRSVLNPRSAEHWMRCEITQVLDEEDERTIRLWAETENVGQCAAVDDPWGCCTGPGTGSGCATPTDPAQTNGGGYCTIRGY